MMKSKKPYVVMLVIGILLALGPVWGLVGTVLAITRAFSNLAELGSASNDVLVEDISLALYTTAAGYIMFPIGIVLIVIAAIKLSKLKKQEQTSYP